MLTLFAAVLKPLTFQDLAVIPEVGEKWYDFGIALGVNEQKLEDIMNKATKPYKKKIDMLRAFLKSPDPTWKRVISALQRCGEHQVAKSVCETYNLPLTLLLYDDTKLKEKSKIVTAPIHFSPKVSRSGLAQSDGRHKSHTDIVDSNALTVDEQRVFHENSSGTHHVLNNLILVTIPRVLSVMVSLMSHIFLHLKLRLSLVVDQKGHFNILQCLL